MTAGFRKVVAVLALAAGAVLIFFEIRQPAPGGLSESWFWFLVGGLMIILGLAEVFSRNSPEKGEKPPEKE